VVSQSRVVAKHEFPGNGVRFIMFIPGLGFCCTSRRSSAIRLSELGQQRVGP
jgi:hypothetical protein